MFSNITDELAFSESMTAAFLTTTARWASITLKNERIVDVTTLCSMKLGPKITDQTARIFAQ